MHSDRATSIERRAETRQPARVTCTLRIGDIREQRAIACIVDWSPSGIGLVTSSPISPEITVVIDCAGVLMIGEVRSCTPDHRAFRIGLLIHQTMASAERHPLETATPDH